MNVNVQIQIGTNESSSDLSGNATEIAEKILVAVGGDPAKDMVNVQINDSGSAGSYATGPLPSPPSVTANSTFATNNSPPPGDKQTRTNAEALTSVTAIYVDNETTEGNDLASKLMLLVIGDKIELRSAS